MKKRRTDEFSFILRPARYGIGVFATHDIKAGTYLRLFRDKNEPRTAVIRNKKDDYSYYALSDIKTGEEITIDYNTLGEPENTKEDYFR